jgi:Formate/nitrite transporter.
MADQNTPKTVKIVDIDAYSPPQIAERIDTIATVKASIDTTKTFLLGILAGAYIAFGAQFATLVTCDSTLHYGLTALVAGIL